MSAQGYTEQITRLIEQQGQNAAAAAERRGQIWGGTLASLGQIPAQLQQQQLAKQHADLQAQELKARTQQIGLQSQELDQRTKEFAQGLIDKKQAHDDAAIAQAGWYIHESGNTPEALQSGLNGLVKAGLMSDAEAQPILAGAAQDATRIPLLSHGMMTRTKEGRDRLEKTTTVKNDETLLDYQHKPLFIAPNTRKTSAELAADAADPKSPTQAQSSTALDLLKPPKEERPLTYGPITPVVVNGKPQYIRTGSDGKTYDLKGTVLDPASIGVPPDKDKTPTNSYQLQPEVDAEGKQTGRFLGYNTKTNAWEPVKGEGPGATKAAPGAAAAATEARSKKDALDTLRQLDAAIDDAKDLVGPGSGRVSNLEQMAGSADPKIQALGVKMKAAKMRADHAITGSVRAGASPVLLQQWDNILANKVTAEGLKAGVKALREILGGDTPTTGKPKVNPFDPPKP